MISALILGLISYVCFRIAGTKRDYISWYGLAVVLGLLCVVSIAWQIVHGFFRVMTF